MTWDGLVQRNGIYFSIRRMEYPEFQTGIFGGMGSTPDFLRIRIDYSVHALKIRPSQRSRFLVLTRRSAASGHENGTEWQQLFSSVTYINKYLQHNK